MVTYLVRGSMLKALIMLGVGLLLGTVGMDMVSGKDRFIFDLDMLERRHRRHPYCGRPVRCGRDIENHRYVNPERNPSIKEIKGYWPNRQDWKDSGGPIARGTVLGFLMGILPGISPMVPTFISYGIEKRISRHPERFGTGTIEGVAAPESCNNAAAIGGFVPLFALGIPSNPFNAVLHRSPDDLWIDYPAPS